MVKRTNNNFLICPRCGQSTFVKAYSFTRLEKFPLWCKNCKRETLVDLEASFAGGKKKFTVKE